MIEGILIFAIGFLCGKYTKQFVEFFKGLYEKYFVKTEDENQDYDED